MLFGGSRFILGPRLTRYIFLLGKFLLNAAEVLLSVGPDLGGGPGTDIVFNYLPAFAVKFNGYEIT